VLVDEEKFWERIEEASSVAVSSMLPIIRSAYCRSFGVAYESMRSRPCQAWQLIALDFVIRDNMAPVLLQVGRLGPIRAVAYDWHFLLLLLLLLLDVCGRIP
jgi:hypothetical protein